MEIAYNNLKPEIFDKKKSSPKQKFVNWFKDPYNKIFLGILLFAIAIRIFYFILTKDQPLWWDESDYLAYAKNLANLGGDWIVTAQHNSLYPFIIAGLFMFGLGEPAIKFILQIIPSILSVWLVYAICNEMYKDKRIGLISSFLMATLWVVVFNSMRFHVGIPGVFTGLLAIYVFWQGHENKKKIFGKINPAWAVPLTVFLVMLTYSIRRGYFVFGAFILIYMLFTKNWKKLIKDKYNWIGLGLAAVLLFLIEIFVFFAGAGEVGSTYFHPENPISLASMGIFNSFFSLGGFIQNISFYLFLIGTIMIIGSVVLYSGHLKKSKDRKAFADLFLLISIVITLINFIFVLRLQVVGEPRWYLPLALGAFIAVSKGTLLIADNLKKYGKSLAIITILLLVGFGGYYQIQAADDVIKPRIPSFSGIKEASLYVKDISSSEDIIVSQPVPQTIYYSERKVMQPEHIAGVKGSDYILGDFIEGVKENPNAKYLLVSFSEPGHPDWMVQRTNELWYIPFMDTRINFATGEQNIRPDITYEGVKFTLLDVKQDVFIYEIQILEN